MPSDVERLLTLIEEHDLPEEALDDLVHDAKSREASVLNNGGLEEQLTYLLDWHSFDELWALIKGAGGK